MSALASGRAAMLRTLSRSAQRCGAYGGRTIVPAPVAARRCSAAAAPAPASGGTRGGSGASSSNAGGGPGGSGGGAERRGFGAWLADMMVDHPRWFFGSIASVIGLWIYHAGAASSRSDEYVRRLDAASPLTSKEVAAISSDTRCQAAPFVLAANWLLQEARVPRVSTASAMQLLHAAAAVHALLLQADVCIAAGELSAQEAAAIIVAATQPAVSDAAAASPAQERLQRAARAVVRFMGGADVAAEELPPAMPHLAHAHIVQRAGRVLHAAGEGCVIIDSSTAPLAAGQAPTALGGEESGARRYLFTGTAFEHSMSPTRPVEPLPLSSRHLPAFKLPGTPETDIALNPASRAANDDEVDVLSALSLLSCFVGAVREPPAAAPPTAAGQPAGAAATPPEVTASAAAAAAPPPPPPPAAAHAHAHASSDAKGGACPVRLGAPATALAAQPASATPDAPAAPSTPAAPAPAAVKIGIPPSQRATLLMQCVRAYREGTWVPLPSTQMDVTRDMRDALRDTLHAHTRDTDATTPASELVLGLLRVACSERATAVGETVFTYTADELEDAVALLMTCYQIAPRVRLHRALEFPLPAFRLKTPEEAVRDALKELKLESELGPLTAAAAPPPPHASAPKQWRRVNDTTFRCAASLHTRHPLGAPVEPAVNVASLSTPATKRDMTSDEVRRILFSRAVCAWGECGPMEGRAAWLS